MGQAAIAIALLLGAQVYTTVGSDKKKKMLQELFPALQDNQFASSRSTDFEQHIKRETNGRGVDIVLNSLAEDKLQVIRNYLHKFACYFQTNLTEDITKIDLKKIYATDDLFMCSGECSLSGCSRTFPGDWQVRSHEQQPIGSVQLPVISKLNNFEMHIFIKLHLLQI